ncbi:lipid-A-disaccharide synthase [Pedobacter cryophilus]|uniref:Lipid-A-disaccharide synthase n=1 Tax=Pedobacter cryophilus TaxID=2571271 RepID=A0A4U1BV99_9SPHI|nr:lipid-A-disaccharide synthase [Pedobacter cryophilus]TKB96719.1 lipid-A-disaccharide synthase [Pedobacter cryophilus]
MKYYLIAGEASGDLHGANLMKTLKEVDAVADFRFYGGDLMQAQGGTLVKHYAEMAFMGFLEVALNIRTVLKNIKECKEDLLAHKPDVLILIDFPGFNLKIAKFAKEHRIKVCYYISPKVWAWNQKRVLKIKRDVDKMFCILPFEVDFYKKWGMEVDYVGNPLLDAIDAFTPNTNFKNDNNLSDKPIIALLPGSRKQELKYILPDMLSVVSSFPNYQFVIAGAPSFNLSFYQDFLQDLKIPIVFNATYDLLTVADAALVTSGTATLETALFKIPQVVLYKGSSISIGIARMLVKIRFISLVNLIMDRKVVTELIQEDCNLTMISKELSDILSEPKRSQMLANYEALANIMGKPGASEKTAKLIYQYLSPKLV